MAERVTSTHFTCRRLRMFERRVHQFTSWISGTLTQQAWSFQRRLIAVFIGLFLIFIWVLVFFSVTVLKSQFEQVLADQQFGSIQRFAFELENNLAERIQSLGGIAQYFPVDVSPQAVNGFLAEQKSVSALFSAGLFVIGLDGRGIAEYPTVPERKELYFGDRDYFLTVVASRQSWVGKPIMGRALKRPLLPIAVPVFDARGNLRAVMVGLTDLMLSNFISTHSNPKMSGKAEFLVLSARDQMIIAATDQQRVFGATPRRGVNPMIDRFLDGFEGSGIAIDSDGKPKLFSGKYVARSSWIVIAALPTAVAFGPVKQMQQYLYWIAFMMTLAAIFIVQWMARRMLAPLENASNAMQDMTDGKTALVVLPVGRADEIGIMIGNFNRLVEERQRYEAVLRESEQRIHGIAANTPGMVFQCVLQKGSTAPLFTYVSEGSMLLLGLTPQQILSDSNAITRQLSKPVRQAFHDSLRHSAQSMQGWNWEGATVSVGGEQKWINGRATPRLSGTGDVIWEGVMLNVTESKHSEQALRQSGQLLRDLSTHMESVREEERKRIAREVHDELGQALTVLRMDVSLLRLHFGGQSPQLMERIRTMTEGVDRTIRIMRHITSTLRPVALDLGLIAGLEWLVEEFTHHAAIHCQLTASGCEEVVLDDGRATALFRIAQESLTNIVKHAEATEVVVSIQMRDHQHVCLEITDNGKGFIPESGRKAGSFGLIGMRERALMLHGEIRIDSTPGVGTRVEVCIPLAQQ
jgi:signal transduction histidine kinase